MASLTRTPHGEFALSDSVTDVGFELGPTGTAVRIRLETDQRHVVSAMVSEVALDRFVRDWVKLRRLQI